MTSETRAELAATEARLDRCQWGECEAATTQGTGYCYAHLGPARVRACEEIRASHGMVAVDEHGEAA